MNYCSMPYDQVKPYDIYEYDRIQDLINHGQYHTNLRKYYKLKEELKILKEKILAYGLPEKFL